MKPTSLMTGAALMSSVAWAACSPDAAPDPGPLSPQFAATACDLKQLAADVRSYFLDNAQRRDAQSQVRAIEDACGGDTAAPGWVLFDQLSSAFNGGAGGDAQVGARIANRLLDCVESSTCVATHAIADFQGAFAPGGTFAHVGDDGAPVTAAGPIGITSAQRNQALAWWGVELSESGSSWSEAVLGESGGDVLIYGAPTSESFGGTGSDVDLSNLGYEFFVYPDLPRPFDPEIDVGVCFNPPESGDPGDFAVRLQRENALLANPQVPGFCSGLEWPTTTAARIASGLRSLFAFGIELIEPDALSAAQLGGGLALLPTGIGGSASNFSRFKPKAALTAGAALQMLPFRSVINFSQNGGVFQIDVRAATGGGTAVDGVTIELYVLGNNGKPAGAVFVDPATGAAVTPTATTIEDTGIASFTVKIGKTGGYTVCARQVGGAADIAFADGCSPLFHVRN